MTAPAQELPVRYCHGCRQYDDHPRAHDIPDSTDPATTKLYHYDCLPDDVRAAHPLIEPGIAAAASGKRGQDVRDVMTAHAASIVEAPADSSLED